MYLEQLGWRYIDSLRQSRCRGREWHVYKCPTRGLEPCSDCIETPQSMSSCLKKSRGPSQDFIYASTGPHRPCSHLMPGLGTGSVMHLVIKSSRIGTLRAENQINACKFPVNYTKRNMCNVVHVNKYVKASSSLEKFNWNTRIQFKF